MSNGFPNPPPIGTDEDASAPGIPQPVIVPGGQSLPPSFPLGTAGTWMPPPLVGEGGNVPLPTPVVPPGTGVSPPYVQFGSGSATIPPFYFPDLIEGGPFQPIVLTNLMQIGEGPPPFTPGNDPIKMGGWGPRPPDTSTPPVNLTPPTIQPLTPPPRVFGTVLVSSNGGWFPGTGLTYLRQWCNTDGEIEGATAATYVLTEDDEGLMIYCIVTARNAMMQTESAMSNQIGPVEEAPLGDEPVTRAEPKPKPKKKKR